MDRRKTAEPDVDDLPEPIESQDWDAIETGELVPESEASNGDLRYDTPDGEAPEEDDDNPMQDSDEALPDDGDESVLRRNPSKEGGRFDEV